MREHAVQLDTDTQPSHVYMYCILCRKLLTNYMIKCLLYERCLPPGASSPSAGSVNGKRPPLRRAMAWVGSGSLGGRAYAGVEQPLEARALQRLAHLVEILESVADGVGARLKTLSF